MASKFIGKACWSGDWEDKDVDCVLSVVRAWQHLTCVVNLPAPPWQPIRHSPIFVGEVAVQFGDMQCGAIDAHVNVLQRKERALFTATAHVPKIQDTYTPAD